MLSLEHYALGLRFGRLQWLTWDLLSEKPYRYSPKASEFDKVWRSFVGILSALHLDTPVYTRICCIDESLEKHPVEWLNVLLTLDKLLQLIDKHLSERGDSDKSASFRFGHQIADPGTDLVQICEDLQEYFTRFQLDVESVLPRDVSNVPADLKSCCCQRWNSLEAGLVSKAASGNKLSIQTKPSCVIHWQGYSYEADEDVTYFLKALLDAKGLPVTTFEIAMKYEDDPDARAFVADLRPNRLISKIKKHISVSLASKINSMAGKGSWLDLNRPQI